ncbi:MAG: very short patch repair endonuclease [Gammaproteobacteria bacterium]|nr:very short patch repair endonuclease [Gammaproteobacteria bacterium]
MARIKSTGTLPELMLRKALWRAGLRFRLHPHLPGKPDLVFPGARVAVFVDGCFWHGCPQHGHLPKSNPGYWQPKLSRNLARDRRVNVELLELGWMPIRIWEHEIALDLPACVARVGEAVQLRATNL